MTLRRTVRAWAFVVLMIALVAIAVSAQRIHELATAVDAVDRVVEAREDAARLHAALNYAIELEASPRAYRAAAAAAERVARGVDLGTPATAAMLRILERVVNITREEADRIETGGARLYAPGEIHLWLNSLQSALVDDFSRIINERRAAITESARDLVIALVAGLVSLAAIVAIGAVVLQVRVIWPLARMATRLSQNPDATLAAKASRRDEIGALATALEEARKARAEASRQVDLQIERLETVASAVTDLIVETDPQTCIPVWSSRDDIFGMQASSGLVRPWRALIHPDDLPGVIAETDAFLSSSRSRLRLEYRLQTKDGGLRDIVEHVAMVRDQDGRPSRVIRAFEDATDRRALEDQLRHAQRMEALGALTGGVAHDLNNVLTVVLGSSHMLVEASDDPDIRDMATMISEAGGRAADMVKHLLAFARRRGLSPRVCDVSQLTSNTRRLLRSTIGQTHRLEIAVDDQDAAAFVDPSELDTALVNLVVNARDATPPGGVIEVRVSTRRPANGAASETGLDGHVEILVIDQGEGMDADTRARAIEPFFTTKPEGKGTGLGLSQVYGFVRQSGGDLEIDSAPGRGTRVSMLLPRARGLTVPVPAEGFPIPKGRGERILLVEDDDLLCAQLARQIVALGYEVHAAPTAEVALDAIADGMTFAAALSDVSLPGGFGGPAFARKLRVLRPDIPVLLMTGGERSEHDLKDEPAVLSKPFGLAELGSALSSAIAAGAREKTV